MPSIKEATTELFARLVVEGYSPRDAYTKSRSPLNDKQMMDSVAISSAHKLLAKPNVAARVAELKAFAASRTTITTARVLEELAKIGFANMFDYMKVQADGTAYVDLSSITRDQAAAISEVVVDEYMEGKGDEARPVKRVKFKLHDKRAALMDIGKHLGMFKERVEHTGPNGGPIETSAKVEVSLLNREERDMLRQLILLAAERKRGQEAGIESPTIAADFEEQK